MGNADDGGRGVKHSGRFIWPALLQERDGRYVRCLTCERRCRLVEGGTGWCRTRRNMDGVLHTLIYGAVSSVWANPIEKKPLYHFHPGTDALTCGSWGCNFGCPWCQNWEMSKEAPPAFGPFTSPAAFVDEARRLGCQGTSISFNEPTLSLEWSLEVFRLARARGLYNTFVTNGYMTPEALHLLSEAGLDGMNVDVKGGAAAVRRHCRGIDVEKVWRACGLAWQAGVHLELTTLVVPGVNDDDCSLRAIAGGIVSELGADVPWHVSAYYPAYRFQVPPTPLTTLERARAIGREAGLRFVYLGNVPGHPSDNTTCPDCGILLIKRWGLAVLQNRLRDGSCPRCGTAIPGVWGPALGQMMREA
ncbi:MAG: AmmeMemoRadiSam system radical SAM enzyme [candidate division NC10 bacterium]|nr:AmmeMemoRadiSam system radical SAM enzyme [candidate division NC10 bacterium]